MDLDSAPRASSSAAFTGTASRAVGSALTLLLASGLVWAVGGNDSADSPARSAQPALASFETVTHRLCRCVLDHEEGSPAFERCRGTHSESWQRLDEELTHMSLTSGQLARFLSTSARAVDCMEKPASYHASAPGSPPRDSARPQSVPGASTVSRGIPTQPGPYSYRTVAISDLPGHLGKLVRVVVRGGNPVRDELVEINATELVLRQGRTRGGEAYEIALRTVERVEVLDRWP